MMNRRNGYLPFIVHHSSFIVHHFASLSFLVNSRTVRTVARLRQPRLVKRLDCRRLAGTSRATGEGNRGDAYVIYEPSLITGVDAGRFVEARLEAQAYVLADEIIEVDDHLTEDSLYAARRPRQAIAERVVGCRCHLAVIAADQYARAEILPGVAAVSGNLQDAAVKARLEV